MHQTKIIIKALIINGQGIIDVFICEVELRCFQFISSLTQTLTNMNPTLYEYKICLQEDFPIRMQSICWKTFPAQ